MNPLLNPSFILRFAIALAYIILGGLLLFSSVTIKIFNSTTQYAFAALLILYGLFRMYRAFKSLKEEN